MIPILFILLTANCADKIIELPISLESFVENLSAERLKELKDAKQENKVLKALIGVEKFKKHQEEMIAIFDKGIKK